MFQQFMGETGLNRGSRFPYNALRISLDCTVEFKNSFLYNSISTHQVIRGLTVKDIKYLGLQRDREFPWPFPRH